MFIVKSVRASVYTQWHTLIKAVSWVDNEYLYYKLGIWLYVSVAYNHGAIFHRLLWGNYTLFCELDGSFMQEV